MSQSSEAVGSFGPNAWLVDDMFERFQVDPSSVSENWREFFADYRPAPVPAPQAPPPSAPSAPAPAVTSRPPVGPEGAVVIKGAASRIVANMEASLTVPTATSVRSVPARLLEVNRQVLNNQLARTTGAKVSFTHIIGYAVVRALTDVPALNAAFVENADGTGKPGVIHHKHVGLGLAVDQQRSDGSRTLLVPCIRDADTLDFRSFVVAYEDLIRKIHTQKISPDDFAGTTVTLTNPGTLGTVQSVPRLMPGQGAIIGVGALAYPAGFEAADPHVLAQLGLGKVVTLTSTYDHRIIQGAESGIFLGRVAALLTGEDGFYDALFASMGVPYEPVRWQVDRNADDGSEAGEHQRLIKQVHVQTLINMYRVRGHLIAHLDPLDAEPPRIHPELDPLTYGLTIWDLPRTFVADGLAGRDLATLDDILHVLRDAYCRTLGIEYMHMQDPEQKRWIQQHVEGQPTTLNLDEQRHILSRLNAAEVFERFLHTRYVGQKRFGLEGAESAIVLLDTLLDAAAGSGVAEVVMGMSHRGRLNVLANIVGKSYREIFEEFEGNLDPESVQGSGDVKYHKGARGVFRGSAGEELPITLASNPSHLEAVDPVVEGMTRAKQDRLSPPTDGTPKAASEGAYGFPCMSVLVHGDAAFAGQGVVAETLNLSGLSGYRTGGTVHVVINNQLGFTTAPASARTSVYPTDVAKMVQAPIFHVNGDDPEACVRAARLAFAFRQAFHKDVVIDLVCYRKHGHNEGDDPSYTQPLMYQRIEAKRSVRKLYTETLVRRGDITLDEAESALDEFNTTLQAVLDEVRGEPSLAPTHLPVHSQADLDPPPEQTGVAGNVLHSLATAVRTVPEGFTIHPKLERQFSQRDDMVAKGQVDWALAEALAIGSLLIEGVNVRLTGQDTRRGTFSQRHAVLVDYTNGDEYIPLAHVAESGAGSFTVRDSLLSEYAAVGFEYGYSVEAPEALVAWEAQFGDFANGAQIIIDNFLAAAEIKWGQYAGLVMLLPHGYEGQGPEHSSSRFERFLALCARGNIRVVIPSTSAQYFHLLRSQAHCTPKRPLIVMTPKSMLRAQASRSEFDELESGSFARLLDDTELVDPSTVRRIVLCSGKIAHEALLRRRELGQDDPQGAAEVAIVRVEQLYPWPLAELTAVFERYAGATEVVWLQEEPENMGAWSFVHARLHSALPERLRLRHVSRSESASPAIGSAALHQLEQADLLQDAPLAEPHHVVVDGSNLATEGRTFPSLAQLDEAVRAYSEEDPDSRITVVVDASFEHRIDESERPLLREAMLNGEVVSPPAGAIGRGDAFALRIAERTGAVVLSNDSFQEFHGQHPWLFEEGRLVGGKPVPGVGWIFSPRLPIRGAKSRAATAGKGSKKDPESAPAKAAELAKAAKRADRRAPKKSARQAAQVEMVDWPLTPGEPPPARRGRRRADPALSDAISEAVAEALHPPAPEKSSGAGSKMKERTAKKLSASKTASAAKSTPAKKSATKKSASKKEADGKAARPAATPSRRKHQAAASTPAPLPAKRRSATPLPAVNEPLAFIHFVAAYPIGSVVEGEVVSYTSHGAMVDVALPDGGSLHCYIPLSAMGDPPPTKARQVLAKGVVRPFVLSGLDPPRRVAELSLPPAPAKQRSPSRKAGATKESATAAGTKKAATRATTKKTTTPPAPSKAGGAGSKMKETTAKKATAKKATAKKAPAKKAATKRAPAKKAATKKAAARARA